MPGRILIADDVATNRIVLKVQLSAAFYDVLQAQSGTEALVMADSERPDLIILDVMMPDLDGIAVCKRLKANPDTADIPVIMATAVNETAARLRALEAGAEDYLTKPIDEMTLLARVRSLLRARTTDEELRLREATGRAMGFAEPIAEFALPTRVALVNALPPVAAAWRRDLLRELGGTIDMVCPEDALNWTETNTPPDVFVVAGDLERPDAGLRLLSELRSRPPTRHAAVIMVLRPEARQQAVIALDLGANDLMTDGFAPRELALRIKTQVRRKRQSDRLRSAVHDSLRLAVTDPLTGLYNRRYALNHLGRIAARAKDSARNFAVMMLDIDRFKSINDSFGHMTGDTVLCDVAKRLQNNLRGVDLIARMGGEEFLVAMPDTDVSEAKIAAERLRRIIEDRPVEVSDKHPPIPVTLSIGVAMGGSDSTALADVSTLIDRADRALYGAKNDGRNQVIFAKSAA